MASEAQYNLAKEKWLEAANEARAAKEKSQKNYNKVKEMGLTNKTWPQWVAYNAS